jgi:hypothetical protein
MGRIKAEVFHPVKSSPQKTIRTTPQRVQGFSIRQIFWHSLWRLSPTSGTEK